MALPLVVRRRAKLDLAEIVDRVAPPNPDAAGRFLDAVDADFAFLTEFPRAGPVRKRVPASLRGLRYWLVSGFRDYLIFYLPTADRVEIVRVLHGARNIGRILREER